MNKEEEAETAFELHQCIACDDICKARSLIENLCQAERRGLTKACQEFSVKPALFVAIERNKQECVEFLLNECSADIEEQLWNENPIGQVSSSPMSPLEFAYFTEKYTISELLLSSGADPTRLLKERKEIVKICRNELISLKSLQILANHGADFNTSDDNGLTCLMQTVRHIDRCRFLLDKGVDVNFKNNDGDTALHLAVVERCCDTVKLLLEKRADPYSTNKNGYDPIHLACINGFEEIVDVFSEIVEDVNRQIESYQLLGTCVYDKKKAMSAWRKAVSLSLTIPNQAAAAKLSTPFGIAVEATSFAELDRLDEDETLFLIQNVVLTRKIFGPNHERLFRLFETGADWFYDSGFHEQFLQTLSFWMRMISDSAITQEKKCCELENCLSKMGISNSNERSINLRVNVCVLFEFVKTAVQVLLECPSFPKVEKLLSFISQFFIVCFQIGHELEVHRFVRSAVILIGEWCERTALIDILSRWLRDRVSNSDILTGIAVLLKCGADVDEVDEDDKNIVDFLLECLTTDNTDRLKEIAAKFVEQGIHLDSKNRKGITTAERLLELGVKTMPPINLMCMAARVVRQHNIPVQGIVPKAFVEFIAKH